MFIKGIKKAGMEPTDEFVEMYKFIADTQVETDFFEKIVLDKNLTLNRLVHIIENKCAGWTRSIENMKKYNIQNVPYMSEEPYPNKEIIKKSNICLA